MEARNRTLSEWFQMVDRGQIKLPRFQRYEAWDQRAVTSLLNTALRGLPAGAALTLSVGDAEKFISRYLVTAPETGQRVMEQLLDGQQRLTALWRAFNDTYQSARYFLRLEWDPSDHEDEPVFYQPRWKNKKGTIYPVWCDSPAEVVVRGLVPLSLVAPGASDRATAWIKSACSGDNDRVIELITKLNPVREVVASYNVPYLELGSDTPKAVALDVFVKMNTNSVKLTSYDVIVAQLEAVAGQSLHDLVESLGTEVPTASRYGDLGDLVLDIACLHDGKPPQERSYFELDLKHVADDWDELTRDVEFGVQALASVSVFDEQRLPSRAVLPVVAALRRSVGSRPDARGNAAVLVSYYLWRSFLTARYEASTSSRAFQDFQKLSEALVKELPLAEVAAPIFDERIYPLPNPEILEQSGWPKKRETLGRGTLALALSAGGHDIADNTPATWESTRSREYHHLFPDSLLAKAGLADRSYTALNCALISWSTNRVISNASPLEYLEDRVNGAFLGEDAIKARLSSHLVPWEELALAGPYPRDADGELTPEARATLVADYSTFIAARAAIVAEAARQKAGAGLIGTDTFDRDRLTVATA